MNTLFDVPPAFPDGFVYIPCFITPEEEAKLYSEIVKTELQAFKFQGYTANRKVASFGFDYSFENGSLSKGIDIPPVYDFLLERVSKLASVEPQQFSELLITEYPPGSVINWHRDAPPFDIIAGLSLLADCKFRLRPFNKGDHGKNSIISIPVAKRSLYILHGPSRENWQHSIAPVKKLRYSITLRTLKDKLTKQ